MKKKQNRLSRDWEMRRRKYKICMTRVGHCMQAEEEHDEESDSDWEEIDQEPGMDP